MHIPGFLSEKNKDLEELVDKYNAKERDLVLQNKDYKDKIGSLQVKRFFLVACETTLPTG